jgi:hypothetical protein
VSGSHFEHTVSNQIADTGYGTIELPQNLVLFCASDWVIGKRSECWRNVRFYVFIVSAEGVCELELRTPNFTRPPPVSRLAVAPV